ncbi:signal peptidase I [Tissierella carlieri]|uniref:Signal peptidase I n=1 Tax=Tissierella carlieri TaxID=689904 RepID=A0ABT1SF29_9FIRM|nr:signal peptidase I [Tissierella carlieri]MCQ4924885.1 signal peptidase I [Tissierella carlieri]
MDKSENKRFIVKLIKTAILAFFLAFIITRIILPTKIVGDSMYPTLKPGSYFLINKLNKSPRIGDIIMFHHDVLDQYLIKRVIAIEGDNLEISNGEVYVNEVKLNEFYVKEQWYDGFYSGIIPGGQIYVIGDNRNGSIDSRNFGTIDKNNILGKLIFK